MNTDKQSLPAVTTLPLDQIVFYIPLEKYVYRAGERWCLDSPVGEKGAIVHLMTLGVSLVDARKAVMGNELLAVHGADFYPEKSPLVRDSGRMYLNVWVPPLLKPVQGTYPTLRRILDWLTAQDVAAQHWLTHWIAYKVQNPAIAPKVAVVLTGQPGTGKNTLHSVMKHMLGPENCAAIQRGDLESAYNGRWINKLLVLGDEVVSKDNFKDISEELKVLIDSDLIQQHAKYSNQRAVKNRIAWIFASNSAVALDVERGDRRYSVFANHDTVPPEYKAMLRDSFTTDNDLSPAFKVEVEAFMFDCLALEVDRALISRPYENEARSSLIDANLPAHEQFFEHVDEHGVDPLLERLVRFEEFALAHDRKEWDFAELGVATQVLYRCYVAYCKDTGQKPLKVNKFGVAVKNHRPVWAALRNSIGSGRRVKCYQVKRTNAANRELNALG